MTERLLSAVSAVSSFRWSIALWVVHGFLDGTVTVAAVVLTESTEVESNPFLRSYLYDAYYTMTWTDSLIPFWKPLALKFAVVGLMAVSLHMVSRCVSRRTFILYAVVLIGMGLLVVLNNLLALRSVIL